MKIISKVRSSVSYILNLEYNIKRLLYIENLNFESLTSNECLINKGTRLGTREVIVSITSFGSRINNVHMAIESIGRQTLKADKIILWLDKNEFTENNLPFRLRRMESRGLSIRYCENFKSYKKIIPALLEFKNSNVVTIDDDIVYKPSLIEELVKEHLFYPNSIIGHRCHEITRGKDGNILPYIKWKHDTKSNIENRDIFITTGGGTLFPPNAIASEFLNYELISSLCPNADDVWVKGVSIISNVECRKVSNESEFSCENYFLDSNGDELSLSNFYKNGNDIQIAEFSKHFKIKI